MKQCTKCKTDKSELEFPRNKNTRDGLGSWCKECVSANTLAYSKTEHGKIKLKEAQSRYFKSPKGREALKRGLKKQIDAGYYRFGKGAIPILRQGAIARGISFELTPETLEAWWQATPDNCSYCGISIEEYKELRDFILEYDGSNEVITKFRRFYRSSKMAAIRWMTIDRTDNAVGYTIQNIVKSCWICNSLKGDSLTGRYVENCTGNHAEVTRSDCHGKTRFCIND